MADAMFEPADFLEESLRWAARVLAGTESVTRWAGTPAASLGLVAAPGSGSGRAGVAVPGIAESSIYEVGDATEWDAAVAATRFFTDGKLHGAAPAALPGPGPGRGGADRLPRRGVRRRGRGPGRPAALSTSCAPALRVRPGAEAGPAARGGTGPLPGPPGHQGRRRRRGPDGGPDRPAVRAAAAGSGRDDRPGPGAGRLRWSATCTPRSTSSWPAADLGRRANRQKALVTGSVSKDGFAGADFVIEAVFEELSVKRQVFAEVEAVVADTCVLATNTSSLPVTAMRPAWRTRSGSSASTSSTR